MTRKLALDWIRYCATTGDTAKAMRIYVENRLSYAAYKQAFREGIEKQIMLEKVQKP